MSRNRYLAVLGGIACVGLGITLASLLITAFFSESATSEEFTAVLTSPAAIIGVVFGVLWLVVKAITSHPGTADRASR